MTVPFNADQFRRELDEWLRNSPTAGASLYDGGTFPAPQAFKAFSDAAYRLADAIDRYDRVLAGRPVRRTSEGKSVLLDLCDALHVLWNVHDEGDLLLEYCEIEGYGHDARTLEIADDFLEIRQQLDEIGRALKFRPDHWCIPAWEWRIRSKQKALWDGVESVEPDGELLLWWAPPDSLDEAVAQHLGDVPDSSLLWGTVREQVNRLLSDESFTFSTEACLNTLHFGEKTIPRTAARWTAQATAIEWARRRRKLREPPRDAFGMANIEDDGKLYYSPVDWGVGLFDSEWECWPILNEVVEECASNISSAAWCAYEHIRYETEIGSSLAADADAVSNQTAASPIVPAAPADYSPPREQSFNNEARALALLVQNPSAFESLADVAKAVGVNRNTPRRWEKFMSAWHAMKSPGDPPRGSKSDDGQIEAESD